jgi:hypothetical protein
MSRKYIKTNLIAYMNVEFVEVHSKIDIILHIDNDV